MTTVTDPGGTPVPVYNRSGTTLVALNAANVNVGGTPSSNPSDYAPITRYSGWTVALATTGNFTSGVRLPDDAEVGDLVEVHCVLGTATSLLVIAASGDTISAGSPNFVTITVNVAAGKLFRKTSATNWQVVGGA